MPPEPASSSSTAESTADPIVAQRRVPILPDDTEATLHDRIKLVERELLAQSLLDIATGTIDLKELVRA